MRTLIFALLTVLCLALDAKLTVLGINPAFTVLLVYYVGLRNGPVKGMLFGILLGTIADSLSGNIMGPNLLGKGTVGFMSSFVTGGFFHWTPFFGLISVLVLTVCDGVVSFTSMALFDQSPTTLSNAAFIILGQALLNSIAGLFLRPRHEG